MCLKPLCSSVASIDCGFEIRDKTPLQHDRKKPCKPPAYYGWNGSLKRPCTWCGIKFKALRPWSRLYTKLRGQIFAKYEVHVGQRPWWELTINSIYYSTQSWVVLLSPVRNTIWSFIYNSSAQSTQVTSFHFESRKTVLHRIFPISNLLLALCCMESRHAIQVNSDVHKPPAMLTDLEHSTTIPLYLTAEQCNELTLLML